MREMDKYKPAVSKDLLLFLAGIAWVCVGIMLLCFAFSWLSTSSGIHIYGIAAAGTVMALGVHHFSFLKIADKNLKRILLMKEKNCLFAFIPWKSYLIIGLMIAMGSVLRHSTVPKPYLAILYIGIGLALILSSIRYLRIFFREIRR